MGLQAVTPMVAGLHHGHLRGGAPRQETPHAQVAPTLTLPRTLTRITYPDPNLTRWRALLSLTLGVVLISSETSPASAANVPQP